MSKDYAALKKQAIELRKAGYSTRQIGKRLGLKSGAISRWVRDVEFDGYNEESILEQRAYCHDELRVQAIEHRRQGWSYNMILEKIPVSKSTLSLWLRDVEVEDKQVILQRQEEGLQRSLRTSRSRQQARLLHIRSAAVADIETMFNGELSETELFLAGLMLYWGEGAKSHHTVKLGNSDPDVIRLFILWVEKCFNITKENLRITVHGYPDTDIDELEIYWSTVTDIPRDQFYKAQVDTRTNKDLTKKGKLRYGTCHIGVVGVGSTYLHRHIMELIQQFKLQIIAGVA